MTLIVPFFFAHQPFRLRAPEERRAAGPLPPGQLEAFYFDDALNRDIFLKVADKCYFPATRLILDMVRRHAGREKPFRVAYGLSGTLLEQAQRYAPDLLDLWKALADTGLVEFTGETYYHSLAGLFDDARVEFRAQAHMHREAIQSLFGQTPPVFRNTEMLYNDAIAAAVQDMGFAGIMTEGVDWLMAGWRSPDFVYRSPGGLPVLLRNYRLSDDIGYRFADRSWDGYPLTAEKFAGWLAGNTDPVVLLAMDYEALGEHIGADTGIFDFLAALPGPTARSRNWSGRRRLKQSAHPAQRPGGRADLLHHLLGGQGAGHQRVARQRDAAVLLRGDQAPGAGSFGPPATPIPARLAADADQRPSALHLRQGR